MKLSVHRPTICGETNSDFDDMDSAAINSQPERVVKPEKRRL